MSVTSASAYPLPRPGSGADARFSLGLALDVAAVLTRHGYPALIAGEDLIRPIPLRHASPTRYPATVPITTSRSTAAVLGRGAPG
jgi:hypothetical protein